MNELLTEMEHITEISKEIGNIITDIEDIASQTNLLSLMLPLKLPEQEKQEEALRWLRIRSASWQRIVQSPL